MKPCFILCFCSGGGPQGSMLGPHLFFITLSQDFCDLPLKFYADDAVLYCKISSAPRHLVVPHTDHGHDLGGNTGRLMTSLNFMFSRGAMKSKAKKIGVSCFILGTAC